MTNPYSDDVGHVAETDGYVPFGAVRDGSDALVM
jgi:hypothetical protein